MINFLVMMILFFVVCLLTIFLYNKGLEKRAFKRHEILIKLNSLIRISDEWLISREQRKEYH